MTRSAASARRRTAARFSGGAPAADRLLVDAVALHRAGRYEDAVARYEQILNEKPRHADALHLLGAASHALGDHEKATGLVRKAIAANKREPAYHNTLGTVLLALGRPDEALVSLRRAISLSRGYAEAHNNLGNAFLEKRAYAEAERCYRRALELQPESAMVHNNLGSAFRGTGRLADAESSYEEALRLRPDYPVALSNLGRVLQEQGRYDEALDRFEAALRLDPEYAEAHANRGILLLTLGRLAEGFREYEWRWRARGRTAPLTDPEKPRWDGANPDGRTVLLQAEQGLGSAIQFARYAPLIAARGGRVLLQCERPLARLFESLSVAPGTEPVEIVVKGEPVPPFDSQAPLLSLPHLMGTDSASIPSDVPYLKADAALVELWRERLGPAADRRVGLVWSGNPRHENDANRSMPAACFGPLLAIDGLSFVSLQIGARQRDLEAYAPGAARDLSRDITDFADTAAVVASLDLIVSVDTAVAHLAGALGRPCWLLVPFVPEWRWQLGREDSPWYPSFRLFRQSAPGDWASVIDRIAGTLGADSSRRNP